MRFPAWLTMTRLEWARVLLQRTASGDTARARDLLGQAGATTRQFGLTRLQRRVEAAISASWP
jgi:hypothetical protein